MSLRNMFEDARLTLLYLPPVMRVRWKLWRAPFAACSKAWGEDATRQLNEARARSVESLVPFEIWRRAHAVRRAARLIPDASCLTQALTLQSVLAGHGEECKLILGVDRNFTPSKTSSKEFEAHAWIEWNGKVIIGGPIERWTPLLVVTPNSQAAAKPKDEPASVPLGASTAPATQ